MPCSRIPHPCGSYRRSGILLTTSMSRYPYVDALVRVSSSLGFFMGVYSGTLTSALLSVEPCLFPGRTGRRMLCLLNDGVAMPSSRRLAEHATRPSATRRLGRARRRSSEHRYPVPC